MTKKIFFSETTIIGINRCKISRAFDWYPIMHILTTLLTYLARPVYNVTRCIAGKKIKGRGGGNNQRLWNYIHPWCVHSFHFLSIQELIGLICHHYIQSGREPSLNNSTPAGYSLHMADDDGLVEEDFAPLDPRWLKHFTVKQSEYGFAFRNLWGYFIQLPLSVYSTYYVEVSLWV